MLENGLYAPNQGILPKYTKGVIDFDKFKMVVSRGLSRESTRIPRFYNNPEIIVINFTTNKKINLIKIRRIYEKDDSV